MRHFLFILLLTACGNSVDAPDKVEVTAKDERAPKEETKDAEQVDAKVDAEVEISADPEIVAPVADPVTCVTDGFLWCSPQNKVWFINNTKAPYNQPLANCGESYRFPTYLELEQARLDGIFTYGLTVGGSTQAWTSDTNIGSAYRIYVRFDGMIENNSGMPFEEDISTPNLIGAYCISK